LIFFCEDCGEKNTIGPEQITDDRVAFKCGSCKYYNSYPVPGKQRSEPGTENLYPLRQLTQSTHYKKKVQPWIKQLNLLPEVDGVFIVHQETVVWQSPEAGEISGNQLAGIVQLLTKNYRLGQRHLPGSNEIVLGIKKRTVLYIEVSNDVFFSVICNVFPVARRCRALVDQAVSTLRSFLDR